MHYVLNHIIIFIYSKNFPKKSLSLPQPLTATQKKNANKFVVIPPPTPKKRSVPRRYEEISRQLKVPPTCIEDVDATRSFIDELPKKNRELALEVEKSHEWYETLENMRYVLREEDTKARFTGLYWPSKLQRQVEYTQVHRREEELNKEKLREECLGIFVEICTIFFFGCC